MSDPELDERALIRRAKAGSVPAYEALVRLHQVAVFRAACLVTSSAEDAEEAAQEAFMRAYRSLSRFRDDAPFRPWILRIVANCARTHRARSRRRFAIEGGTFLEHEPAAGPGPEGEVLGRESRQALVAALERLKQGDRAIVACRFFLDMSEEEMAGFFNVPRGTVKSRLSRALGRLGAELGAAT
jgi:RNA polymerase sigma-70 factor (ECF subfamily)